MRICMLSELFYPYMLGGAERRYFEIARRLAKKHDVTVHALNLQGARQKETVENIEIIRHGAAHPTGGRNLPVLASFFPAVLRSLKSEYDIADANQGVSTFAGFARPAGRPLVATFHDIYWNKWGEHFSFPYSSVGKTMEFLWSKGKYTRIIANSPETKKRVKRLGFSAPVETVPSGVDLELINSVKGEKRGNTVVYAGRLERYKNVAALIRAVAGLRRENLVLKIIGSGPEEKNLRDLAKSLGVDAEFLGFVSEKRKFELVKSAGVLVNPSSVEGLGLIVLEAMACGTPVVVRNLDCYFFCSRSNSVSFRNDADIGKSILAAMGGMKISRAGLKTAGHFSWDKTAEKVEALYESCL